MCKFKKIISFCVLFVITFGFSLHCFAETTTYVWSSSSTPVNFQNDQQIQEEGTNVSTITTTSETAEDDASNTSNEDTNLTNSSSSSSQNSLNLESASAILIEQSTGQVLYEHNSHEQLRPASVTKIMSILLIMEALDSGKISLSDQVPCSENAASMGGSQIWLDPRETLTVDEMLKAICVASANDCVVAMAEFVAGSEEAFVQIMNDKAKELRNE